ncbi:MAG: helix-turn-helix transcriptional regulator [Clostridiales bacterium]|nr:helix-turn-helix transcriptional regulator [Clostridiales bacterium]
MTAEQMTIAQIVGENLKSARKAKGLTQKQVAAYLNKYQPDYSEYESGLVQLDYEKIISLCKLLDITPNDLFSVNK